MSHLASTFSALGDTTRFAIVERLLKEGELSAGELQGVGDISPPAISRHLKVLREANIIIQRVDKQRRMYSVRANVVRDINDWAMSYQQFWQGSLDRLAVALEKGRKN